MDTQRVCGTCLLGGVAYDRYGEPDPGYVICQIKEAENRKRKPDRLQVTSGVSRMHNQREACLHWQPRIRSAPAAGETELYLQEEAFKGGGSNHRQSPTASPTPVPPDQNLKDLKLQLIQQEQMIASLQRQNLFLSEQLHETQQELRDTQHRLESLKPFDPAIFSEVNYFSLLGVKENADNVEVKEAYRRRMKFLHPDRFLNISQRLNTAYETLMDPQKRQQYLQQIKGNKHV